MKSLFSLCTKTLLETPNLDLDLNGLPIDLKQSIYKQMTIMAGDTYRLFSHQSIPQLYFQYHLIRGLVNDADGIFKQSKTKRRKLPVHVLIRALHTRYLYLKKPNVSLEILIAFKESVAPFIYRQTAKTIVSLYKCPLDAMCLWPKMYIDDIESKDWNHQDVTKAEFIRNNIKGDRPFSSVLLGLAILEYRVRNRQTTLSQK